MVHHTALSRTFKCLMGSGVIGLLWILSPVIHAADEPNWSSGLYRVDPNHSPFQKPKNDPPQRDYRDQERRDSWWQQERYPYPTQEQRTPRIWDYNEDTRLPGKKNRPWGEIPSALEDYPADLREGPPSDNNDPFIENDWRRRTTPRRYSRDSDPYPSRSSPYWDGPYQREEYRDRPLRQERYRDYPEPSYEVDPWWRGSRNRSTSPWDPWESDRYQPRERY
ncbi:MAG: hypothetical protein HQL94_08105 [Magnetococcales bacterium]|nr:hypothetical protein [Magnetococcales bacterium]MBF0437885.1 hypothetical protein [Magnetococcales bacterium]